MKCRILVVEDSATQAEALKALLETGDNEVEVARSGEAALERVAEAPVDIVLSDVMMGGMTGYELCRQLKDRPEWRDVPVVLLTSLTDPMDIIRGLECGADSYITKPYDPDHLLARVRNVLDNRRFRRNAKTSLGVNVRFLGRELAINSEKEQILDLFISSVEDVVRTNEALQASQRALADAHARLEAYAAEKVHEARVWDARYHALLQNAPDAILVLDLDATILEANPPAADFLLPSKGELQGRNLFDLLPPEGLDELRARFAHLGFERQMVLGERGFVRGDGSRIWCELTASATRLDGEELVLLIARDVTVRRNGERALHATNERLRTLIESSPLAIVMLDSEGRVEFWNPAAQQIFGWTAREAVGRCPAFVPQEEMEKFRASYRRVLAGEAIVGMELRRVRKDGTPVDVSLNAAPLRAATGETVGGMAVIADVTGRKRMEQAIREREDAERANRAKSEFLSRMSHELRTPLNAVLGFAQLLDMDDLTPEQAESVEQIHKAGRHLLTLIDEVLDLSRVEEGRSALSLAPVPVRAVVDEVARMMRPLADQQAIRLVVRHGDDHTGYVRADAQRLKQVLLNFVSNAIKYNRPSGEVGVTVSGGSDGYVRIAVRDTGIGLSPAELGRLFVPFERLGAASRGIPGTGLGLTLARGLAEAMEGRVGVESREGEGSTFWIELRPAGRPADGPPHGGTTHAAVRAVPADPGAASTVLYIEDNEPNVRLVQRILRARPRIRLLTAMQGELGLELAREHRPDLILLDVNLPDLTADEVLDTLRGDPSLRDVPVVVISADAMPTQVRHFLAAGAREYLTKPLDVKQFLEVVDAALGGPRREAGQP